MTNVLGVHGIWNYKHHRQTGSPEGAAAALAAAWTTDLRHSLPPDTALDLDVAFYAHHLRRGTPMGPESDVSMMDKGEQDFLVDWVECLAPGVAQGTRTVRVRQAADWLTRKYGTAARGFAVAFCREVHTYLARPDSPRRAAARRTVADAIAARRPDVLVAHSLGSVVAYETLWAHQDHDIDLLVTLGSPLAMPGVVLPRLVPPASRPPRVRRWLNIADVGDIVAIPRAGLRPDFDGVEADLSVVIGPWDFHTVGAYLRTPDVAKAILDTL